MADMKVGKVSHYYDKIGVAVIDLETKLAVGDRIRFVLGEDDLFEQEVNSLEAEHKKINSAGKGESVGVKAEQKVKEGAKVFKVG